MLVPIYGEPFNILKYDQVIHGYCYFVVTLFVYSIVQHISHKKANPFLIGLITVLAGASIGAVNEILEFTTVVLFDAGDAVGGYYNNALDLIFNFIGAVIAACLVVPRKQKIPETETS
jgi:putative membrane protein